MQPRYQFSTILGPILVPFYSFSTEFDTQCSVVALGTKCKIADLMNRDILRQAHLGVSLLPFGAVVSQWNFYNRQGGAYYSHNPVGSFEW